MLHFFRKYQRYVFLMVTIVIIISFSFFGTYSTLPTDNQREVIAFTAVDGTQISRFELDEMVYFISTDNEEKMLYGGVWGPNFLNDGVIKKDFLETGMANILAKQYFGDLQGDLQARLKKEQYYKPYVNSQAPFISAENAWGYFAPELQSNLNALRQVSISASPEDQQNAFNVRVQLFLAERNFPSNSLRQVLRYQERQHNLPTSDAQLAQSDLSLFGYHSTEDWFGPRFTRLVAEFIINTAKIAEEKGYRVSQEEALVDLVRNAEISFNQNRKNQQLDVASREEYFKEQLRRYNLDQAKASQIWRQVLLFRRYFHDVGNAVFIDPLAYKQFNAYAKEMVEGDLYRFSEDMRLGNFNALQLFEIYLQAVAKNDGPETNPLALPTDFKDVSEVLEQYPELVQKRYFIEFAEANKQLLQAKVGIKEMWNWEVSDQHWESLKKTFPILGIKAANTNKERFAVLDSLDDSTRMKIDELARAAIVDEHPEWIESALDSAKTQKKEISLGKGSTAAFVGLEHPEQLISWLDEAPIGDKNEAITASAKEAQEALQKFSADNTHYYRISVIERIPQWEILTFAEAQKSGVLRKVLLRQLDSYYTNLKKQDPTPFQRADNSFKSLNDVQDLVAERYFSDVLQAIAEDYAMAVPKKLQSANPLNNDLLATYRLFALARDARSALQKDSANAQNWYTEGKEAHSLNALTSSKPLQDQWKLRKSLYHLDRTSSTGAVFMSEDPFTLDLNTWSNVHVPPNGDITFFELKKKGLENDSVVIIKKVEEAHHLLSAETRRLLTKQVLQEIDAKKAISLEYLKPLSDEQDNN